MRYRVSCLRLLPSPAPLPFPLGRGRAQTGREMPPQAVRCFERCRAGQLLLMMDEFVIEILAFLLQIWYAARSGSRGTCSASGS